MALTATYDDGLSRVRLAADTLGATAADATFDRSVDGVTWTTVRGGLEVTVSAQTAFLDDYEFPAEVPVTYRVRSYTAGGALVATFTTVATFTLDGEVWVKSVSRPFLNRAMWVMSVGDVERRARNGVFDIVGRSTPVAVTDVRPGKEFVLTIVTETEQESEDFDHLLASGDPVFLHTPPGFPVKSLYAVLGQTSMAYSVPGDPIRVWSVPFTQCAAPGPDVVGSSGTWQTVLSTYATWADLLAAKATWQDVLELVGDPGEVIVP